MHWWWFWRENNRNKIPPIPTPPFSSTVQSFPSPRPLLPHFRGFLSSTTTTPTNAFLLFSAPPTPYFYSFISTATVTKTTTFLFFSFHHHHHHIAIVFPSPYHNISIVFFSIVSRATLWRHIIAELSRVQRSTTGKKYGNLCFQEILVLRKSSIRTSTPSC